MARVHEVEETTFSCLWKYACRFRWWMKFVKWKRRIVRSWSTNCDSNEKLKKDQIHIETVLNGERWMFQDNTIRRCSVQFAHCPSWASIACFHTHPVDPFSAVACSASSASGAFPHGCLLASVFFPTHVDSCCHKLLLDKIVSLVSCFRC
jgi:hypothetical protein